MSTDIRSSDFQVDPEFQQLSFEEKIFMEKSTINENNLPIPINEKNLPITIISVDLDSYLTTLKIHSECLISDENVNVFFSYLFEFFNVNPENYFLFIFFVGKLNCCRESLRKKMNEYHALLIETYTYDSEKNEIKDKYSEGLTEFGTDTVHVSFLSLSKYIVDQLETCENYTKLDKIIVTKDFDISIMKNYFPLTTIISPVEIYSKKLLFKKIIGNSSLLIKGIYDKLFTEISSFDKWNFPEIPLENILTIIFFYDNRFQTDFKDLTKSNKELNKMIKGLLSFENNVELKQHPLKDQMKQKSFLYACIWKIFETIYQSGYEVSEKKNCPNQKVLYILATNDPNSTYLIPIFNLLPVKFYLLDYSEDHKVHSLVEKLNSDKSKFVLKLRK